METYYPLLTKVDTPSQTIRKETPERKPNSKFTPCAMKNHPPGTRP
jgi:hypothetical protein